MTPRELAGVVADALRDADGPEEDHDDEQSWPWPSVHLTDDVTFIKGEPATLGVELANNQQFFITVERA